MKKLIVISLLLVFVVACKQTPTAYTITGTVTTKEPVKEVFLREPTDTIPIAKAKVVEGKFTLTGQVKAPILANLYLDTGEYREMVLENDNYQAIINDDFKYIKGGDFNEMLYSYTHDQAYLEATKKLNEATKKEFENISFGDLKAYDEANKKLAPLQKEVRGFSMKQYASVLEGEAPAIVKLYALSLHYDWDNYGFERKLELLDEYEKELPNNAYLIDYRKMIHEALENEKRVTNTAPGKQFIDFTATTIDGEPLALSDVVAKNKYTLVEFWASWCGPCRASFPHLKKKYEQYKDKGFQVYGISLDTDKEMYLKASKDENLPWINTVDHAGFKSDAAQDYAVKGIPYTVLIGQDGVIIDSGESIRGLALDDKLKELYNE